MQQCYFVYAIELEDTVLKNKKFLKHNPKYRAGKLCLYIGQSVHKPSIRFDQHKNGYKSSRIAKKYGIRLLSKICKNLNPFNSRKEAIECEDMLTDMLRENGYGVWSN